MKKKLLALTMAVMVTAGMIGCGSGSNEEPAASEPAEETTSEGVEAEASGTEEAEASNGAASGEAASGADVSELTLAYVPTTMNNPFWTAMMGGIKAEMEAKGMNPDTQLVTVDADSDQATMNNYIYDLINQDVDAVIMAPMDCTACTEALQACVDAIFRSSMWIPPLTARIWWSLSSPPTITARAYSVRKT